MALKVLMLRKKIADAQKKLEALRSKDADFDKREKELETSIPEAETDEEKATVEEEVGKFETEKAGHENEKAEVEKTIADLEAELKATEEANEQPPASAPAAEGEERKDVNTMNRITRFADMTMQQRTEFAQRDKVKEFLTRARTFIMEKRSVSGTDLAIPTEVLELLRPEVEANSKLYSRVRVERRRGNARIPVEGTLPEGVWMEACGALNELDIAFNIVEMDGFKVGGFFAVCNATLADSDIALLNELLHALGVAIAKGLDKGIIFGTDIKMPLGIATRLAQTTEPESWGDDRPAWTDLHTSNVLTLNIGSESGTTFFSALINALGVASPKYSRGKKPTWIMNHKTHMDILSRSLGFNSSAAIVAGVNDQMPVVGGDIIEMDDDQMQDYEIIGGYLDVYVLVEREGASIATSEHARFIQDQMVARGYGRYDGDPVIGEAFVIVNYNNTAPTTSATFPADYANADIGFLGVTAAAGTAAGDTVLTVTGTELSGTTLAYKLGNIAVENGKKVRGFTALTSGTTQITAAAGTPITVVELNGEGRAIKVGRVASIPKTA